jgi:hypothetical protein
MTIDQEQTILEVSPFFLQEIIECYPDAQYLHMERDVDTWYRSMDNTGGPMFAGVAKFPLKQMRSIDDFVDKFCSLHLTLEGMWCHGRLWKEGEDVCKEDYLAL